MVLEGIKNTPITQETYILAEQIERFWDSLDFKDEPWCPAISPYGEVVWSSNVNYKSINFNPYRAKLTNLVRSEQKNLPQITQDILKPEYQLTHEEEEKDEEELHLNIEKIQDEREDFLSYYLSHIDKALPWPYELKTHYPQLDEHNYFDQVFVSPF
jgi:hypothetical protein